MLLIEYLYIIRDLKNLKILIQGRLNIPIHLSYQICKIFTSGFYIIIRIIIQIS